VQAGTLHLLTELVHIEGKSQTPSGRAVTHKFILSFTAAFIVDLAAEV
jgi:hypothetical protein